MKMIKIHLMICLAVLMFWNKGNSQVVIDQELVSGVWGPNQTYVIKNDVRVPAGATLTIQKGVTVRLNPGVRITVNGILKAVGTPNDTIRFIPDIPGTNWNNITFKNTTSPTLQYCLFEGTEKVAVRKRDDLEDMFGALNVGLDSDFDGISDCTFRNNLSGAIFIGTNLADVLTIKNTYIRNGQNFGITIHGGFYDKITFDNNVIAGLPTTQIGFTGIKVLNANALEIVFQNNKISEARTKYDSNNSFWNHPGGAVIVESPAMANISSVTFQNDQFSNSNGKKAAVFVSASKISLQGVNANGNFGAVGGGCYLHGIQVDINGSTFSNNVNITTSDSGTPVNSGGGGVAVELTDPDSKLNIAGCTFSNNNLEGFPGGGLRIFGDNQDLPEIQIQECSFKENATNLYGGAVAISGFNSINKVTFGKCSFQTNLAKGSKGGSGLWIDKVKAIGLLSIQESPLIKDHEALEGNGGFVSVNGLATILDFRYSKNNHSGYARTGKNGGLIYLDAKEIIQVQFRENIGITAQAGLSGSVIYAEPNLHFYKILISQNQILKSEALNGEGGAFYFNTDRFFTLQFVGNSVDYSYAKSSGGFLYFNYATGNDISLSDNSNIRNSRSDAAGGCFFIKGSSNLKEYFTFDNNTFGEVSAAEDGGALWFHGNLAQKELPFYVTDNVVTGSSVAKGKGGFARIGGAIRQSLFFKGNNIKVTSAVLDGGFAYLEPNALQAERLVISDNWILENSASITGTGGVLSGEGSVKVIEVENNSINKLFSMKQGGGFYWKNMIQGDFPTFDVVVRLNKLTGNSTSEKSSGGFLYVEADTISNLYIKENQFEKLNALISGGGFFVHTTSQGISDITLYKNSVSSALATEQNGGFACFLSSTGIDNLAIDENLFKGGEFKAGADGGIVQVTANRYRKLSVYKNHFTGSLKAVNGGFLCLYGNIPVHPWSGKISFLNNIVSASASVSNGGFVMISGNQDQSFLFKGNEFSGSMNALNKGGILALVNGSGKCDSILISGNKFLPATPNGLIMAKTGGVLHYEGNFTVNVFQFSQNKVKQARADAEGAVLYVRNNAPGGYQDICQITDNEFDNLSTEINGAVISQNGPVKKRFLFKNNLLSNVFMTGANSNGGALYLHIGLQNKITSVGIENNKVVTETSLGGGTFLKFTGSVADTILVKRNSFTDISSKLTGAFDVNADTISHFISTANQVREVSGQIGALYYLAGDNKAYLEQVVIREDTLKTVRATGEGGAIFLNFPLCNEFSMERVILEKMTSGATGGFLAAHKGILLKNMTFDRVDARYCAAGGNGGFAGLSGTFGKIVINSNYHLNSFAVGNGGSFYLESLNAPSGLMQVKTSTFEGDKEKMSGNGGAFYLESVGEAEFDYTFFRDLRAKTNGGALYARAFNRMLTDICSFNRNIARENSGGALYLDTFADLITHNNIFRENLAQAGSGGACYISNGNVVMKNDSVVGNSAFTGGGITFVSAGGTVDSLSFRQNYTTDPSNISSFGGGLYINNNRGKPLQMQDCWFYKNNAFQGGGMYGTQSSTRQIRSIYAYNLSSKNGGAVYLLGSPANVFYNSIFHRNSVIRLDYGIPPTAGIHVFSVSPSSDSVRIVNSVFNRNNSYAVGLEIPEGRKVSEYKPVEVANSILFYNGYLAEDIPQYKGSDGLINFIYSDVEDLDLKKYGATNINLLPNWLTPNYCLRTALPFVSPCIDRGNPVAAYNDPDGTRNDMGITGGPYAKYFCTDTYFRDDNSPVEEEEIQQSGFAIYPNPTSGKVWIVPGSVIGQSFTVDIISPFGKTIWSERKETGFGSRTEIELGNLPNGLYLIQVRNLSSRVVKKIIKM